MLNVQRYRSVPKSSYDNKNWEGSKRVFELPNIGEQHPTNAYNFPNIA